MMLLGRFRKRIFKIIIFVLFLNIILQIKEINVSNNERTEDSEPVLKFQKLTEFFIEQIPNNNNRLQNVFHKIKLPLLWVFTPDEDSIEKLNETYLVKRLQRYQDSCRGREHEFGRDPQNATKTHFKISVSHHILFCAVEKAGSTFWKRMLQMMDSTNIESPFQILPLHVNDRTKSFFEHDVFKILATLKTNFVFMFARNPFTRLLSGYLDKVYTANPYYWNIFGKRIRPSKPKAYSCYNDITFQEMIEYVVESEGHFKKARDRHFMAMFDKCKLCQIPYDFIGKMETFESDFRFLMKTWNVSVFEGVDFKESVVDDIFLDVATSIESRKKYILPCISLHEAYLRSWRHMQIKGLITNNQVYPFLEKDSANITSLQLIKAFKTAYLNSNPVDLKSQKAKYFESIYRTVTLKSLKMFVEAVRPDFDIVGYDPFPKVLFNDKKHRFNHSDIFNPWKIPNIFYNI